MHNEPQPNSPSSSSRKVTGGPSRFLTVSLPLFIIFYGLYLLIFLAAAPRVGTGVAAVGLLPAFLLAYHRSLQAALLTVLLLFAGNLLLMRWMPLEWSLAQMGGLAVWHATAVFPLLLLHRLRTHAAQMERRVAAHQLTEKTLINNQLLLRRFLEQAPDGVIVLSAVRNHANSISDFKWTLVNRQAAAFIAHTADDLMGASFLRTALPFDKEELFAQCCRVVASAEPVRQEYKLTSTEQAQWVLMQIVKLNDGAAINMSDITQRKKTETALYTSEERFRIMSENVRDLLCLHEPNGRYIYVSPSVYDLFGYEPAEMIGRYPLHFFHPEDLHKIRSPEYFHALAHSRDITIQYRLRKKNGQYAWVDANTRFVHDESGQVKHLLTLTRDITKQREYEEKLKESEARAQRLALVAKHTDNGVIITDERGNIEWINEGFTRMTGYYLDEITGKKPGNLLQGPRSDPQAIEFMRRCVEKQKDFVVELVNYDKKGHEYWVRVECQPLFAESGELTGFMAIESNITERKEREAALQLAKEEAEKATQIKSQFLANMSHEIRTPINAIIGLSSLLLDTPLTSEQQDFIETLRVSSNGLLNIINDILDFSKIEAGRLELETTPFNLNDCINGALELVTTRALQKNLELVYLVAPDVPEFLTGDETRLRQILVNLLSNAVKFTEEGEVVISVTGKRLQGDRYRIRFSVIDTGLGIPPDRMDRLFQSFSQVDSSMRRRFGGTGLGLVISKRLAEAMGGQMWVESQPGHGSTFSFTIVVDGQKGEPTYLRPFTRQPSPKLLIVDDSQISRFALSHYLQSWQLSVKACTSAVEALAALKPPNAYSAILIDMDMPQMNGVLLAQKIREQPHLATLPIVLLTPTHVSQPYDRKIITATVSKPIQPNALHATLQAVLNGRPKAKQKQTAVEQPTFDETFAARYPLRILLAEDNAINQKVALRILERIGYRADLAANGLEVMEAVQRQMYDVILMDIQMPEMDGMEATQRIRISISQENQPQIIAVTANALKGDRERFLNAGMDDYISKPVRVEEIKAALRRATREQSNQLTAVSPSAAYPNGPAAPPQKPGSKKADS